MRLDISYVTLLFLYRFQSYRPFVYYRGMMHQKSAQAVHLHRNVPPNWYHVSIRNNLLQRFWHWRRFAEIPTMIDHVDGAILDIGCADGVFSDVLLRATGASSLIGIDVLPASVDWANQHWKNSNMHFQTGDAHHLDFSDSSFSAVFCMEMLEHVFDPALALREMFRVVKPGGYMIVLVPTDSILFRSIWFVWTRLQGRIWHDTHIQSFRKNALSEAVAAAGFTVEKDKRFLLGMLCAVKGRKPA